MKNIIITGAANGVGKAVANILKENNLILIDEDYKNLEQVAKDLNANGDGEFWHTLPHERKYSRFSS